MNAIELIINNRILWPTNTYLTRIFARSCSAHHVIEDFVFASIKFLAFGVSHHLNSHLS